MCIPFVELHVCLWEVCLYISVILTTLSISARYDFFLVVISLSEWYINY